MSAYKKAPKKLLDTIKGLKVNQGGLTLKELKTSMLYYAINDVETENLYYLRSRRLVRMYAARMLFDRYVLSKRGYADIVACFGKLNKGELSLLR